MLDTAQEPVGAGQPRRILPAHVAARGQRVQRVQGGPDPQRLIGPAVHQLEQLDRELNVAQAARAQLELTARLIGGQAVEYPPPHRLHVRDEMLALGRLPDHGRQGLQVVTAKLGVARHRPALEQRLELPGLGPALVIRTMAGQRPHQRPVPAFRAQVRVDREQRALGRGLRADADRRGGQLGRGPQRGVLARPAGRCRDEDHIDVGGVVQLPAAAFAHRDHGQPALARLRGQLGPGDRQGGLERRGGQVSQLGRGLAERHRAGQVPGRQVQQPPAVGHPQRRHLIALGAGRRQQLGAQFPGFRTAERLGPGQHPPLARMPGQLLAQRDAVAEHGDQPVTQAMVGP